MKKLIIVLLLFLCLMPVFAQTEQELIDLIDMMILGKDGNLTPSGSGAVPVREITFENGKTYTFEVFRYESTYALSSIFTFTGTRAEVNALHTQILAVFVEFFQVDLSLVARENPTYSFRRSRSASSVNIENLNNTSSKLTMTIW
ncbi:MAG: hypothetical protein FWC01_03120 [Treponema sp.]|nr:hypothetical protein [Treponema sp.]MCL2236982.1 hypothetical protein [Treponema sp.]